MSQRHRLIDGFCDALVKFTQLTGDPFSGFAYYYVLIRVGAGWSRHLDVQLGLPADGSHDNLTVDQVRRYLVKVAEDTHIWEDVLITGLVAAVQRELEEQLRWYSKAELDRIAKDARQLQDAARHPEKYPEEVEIYRAAVQKHGSEVTDADMRSAFRDFANFRWTQKDDRDNPAALARARDQIAAWREMAAKVTDPENIATWNKEFMDDIGRNVKDVQG